VSDAKVERLFMKGTEALAQDNTLSALSYFEKAMNIEDSLIISSYFAFCIAKERGQLNKAISLCEKAIKKDPENSIHYLNLGKIYLLSNKREDAIKIFSEGLNYEANQKIVDELNKLGTRKFPVMSSLKRSSLLNKYLGIMFDKMRLR
jgi:tetratricopeptide (TPR) repeat protein